MLNQVLFRPFVIRNYQCSLFSDHIDAFAALLIERGHPLSEVRGRLAVVLELSRWMEKRDITLPKLGDREVQQFLRYRKRKVGPGRFQAQRVAVRLLCQKLREEAVIPPAPQVRSNTPEIDALVNAFAKYLETQRGLLPTTYQYYSDYARRFLLQCFGSKKVLLTQLGGKEIQNFILQQSRRQGPRACQKITTALRSFFKFALLQGKTAIDLGLFVPTVSNRKLRHIPCFLSPMEVQRVLDSCSRSSAVGRRNYALLKLLSRFGLRAIEVRRLTLDDIDWDAGEISIRGKGRRQNRFPLAQDIGEAVAEYLKNGRPNCPSRSLFICSRAPHRGLNNSSSVSAIVRRALARSGLNPSRQGAHLFRHSTATQILHKGASLNEVAEILRHRQINTSAIYGKVDLPRLQTLGRIWPGSAAAQGGAR